MGTLNDLNVKVSTEKLPWGDSIVARVGSDDERLDGYKAIVVSDTVPEDKSRDERLTTMIVDLPRCILPEMNTHRVFSRNSASSRARSVRTTISSVMEHPYVPLFTGNHKGMSGDFLSGGRLDEAVRTWMKARDRAVSSELSLLIGDAYDGDESTVRDDWNDWVELYYRDIYHDGDTDAPSVHKQNANRLIEPFMWHEMLITSSYWDNFFRLRIDSAAQPEMQVTAILMQKAMQESTPERSNFHVPFIGFNRQGDESLRSAFLKSATECARISYKDRSSLELNDSMALASKMIDAGHMSPFEHQAVCFSRAEMISDRYWSLGHCNGNLEYPWVQFRKVIENESEW